MHKSRYSCSTAAAAAADTVISNILNIAVIGSSILEFGFLVQCFDLWLYYCSTN